MPKSKVVSGGKTVSGGERVSHRKTISGGEEQPVRHLEIVYVPLTNLKLWETNPRRNDAASMKLAKLIAVHGFNSPLVCTLDNVIRKGNTAYKAAKILELEDVPVVYIDFPSEEQGAMYAIADNRSGEFSEWDTGLLMELMGQKTGIPLEDLEALTGFSQPEIMGLREMYTEGELKEQLPGHETKPKEIKCPECGHTWME